MPDKFIDLTDARFAQLERDYERHLDALMDEWIDSHDAPDMEDEEDVD